MARSGLGSGRGAIHLFRLAGVDLYLHWSWFVVALIEIESRNGTYSSIVWNIAEYLALFAIVLTHEFGHAMACRSVGGTANRILLWPFGGVAFVDPPQRPGAMLWSIAAGPLVNVVLAPVLLGVYMIGRSAGWADTMPDAYHFVFAVLWIDVSLLIFNMLPIYPLDGGQILRSLLWFFMGRGRSLMVAVVIGFVGLLAFLGFAVWVAVSEGSIWLVLMSVYLLLSCWNGWKQAQALLKLEKLPRRAGFACPSCRTAPPLGGFWRCGQCQQGFDTFETGGVCPNCGAQYPTTMCLDCRRSYPLQEWVPGAATGAGVVSSSFTTR